LWCRTFSVLSMWDNWDWSKSDFSNSFHPFCRTDLVLKVILFRICIRK
jgi:hypothetical protein